MQQRDYQYDCLTTMIQSNNKIVYAELAPGTGKSNIIYKLYTKFPDCVVKTEQHLVNQLQKQFQYYSNSEEKFRIQETFIVDRNVRYLIIDEFKPEQLDEINKGQFTKIFCFNCWYPHTYKPDFKYTITQAIDDGILCDYKIIKSSLKTALQSDKITKGLILISSKIKKQMGIHKYRSEKRYIFQASQDKFMYITLDQIEGLSVPFVNAIIYDPDGLDEYQRIQIIGRVLRKDKKNNDKVAYVFEV